MITKRIKFVEKLICECVDQFGDYKSAYEQTMQFLRAKDLPDKTNYCSIAETAFGKAPNFTVLQLSDQSRSCESSVYQYRKYIVKTFFYFFVKERNLPFSADTEFDDIFNYFSALA